jgi:hypothetical protein
MIKPLAIFIAFIAISCVRIGVADGQLQTTCNPALFKDYSTGTKTADETFAVLDIVDQDNFAEFQKAFSGNINIPIYGVPVSFGASYSSFDQQRAQLHKQYQTNYASKAAQGWLDIRFSTKGSSLYMQCLEAYVKTAHGIHLWVKDVSPQSAVVYLQWNPPPGLGAVEAVVTAQGAADWMNKNITLQPNAATNFLINRAAYNGEVSILVNAGGYPDDVTIKSGPTPSQYTPCEEVVNLWYCENGGLITRSETACDDASSWGHWGPPHPIKLCKTSGSSAETIYVCSKGGIGTNPAFCKYIGGDPNASPPLSLRGADSTCARPQLFLKCENGGAMGTSGNFCLPQYKSWGQPQPISLCTVE